MVVRLIKKYVFMYKQTECDKVVMWLLWEISRDYFQMIVFNHNNSVWKHSGKYFAQNELMVDLNVPLRKKRAVALLVQPGGFPAVISKILLLE